MIERIIEQLVKTLFKTMETSSLIEIHFLEQGFEPWLRTQAVYEGRNLEKGHHGALDSPFRS
jgi:hypothetical protein